MREMRKSKTEGIEQEEGRAKEEGKDKQRKADKQRERKRGKKDNLFFSLPTIRQT